VSVRLNHCNFHCHMQALQDIREIEIANYAIACPVVAVRIDYYNSVYSPASAKRTLIHFSAHRTVSGTSIIQQHTSRVMLVVDSQRHVTCMLASNTALRCSTVLNFNLPHCASKIINYINLPNHTVLCTRLSMVC